MNNIVVDLYDCSSSEIPNEWILVTRTSNNSNGNYEFTVPSSSSTGNDIGGGTTSNNNNLSLYLKQRDITKIRAVFTLPVTGLSYEFSMASQDSDVNERGETSCWDVSSSSAAGDGDSGATNIVWNAGIITSSSSEATTEINNNPSKQPTSQPPVTATTTATGSGILGGYAFLDTNNDGNRGDASSLEQQPMSNVNIQLYTCTPSSNNNDAASSFGSTTNTNTDKDEQLLLAVTNTNSQGLYNFLNLNTGYYRISIPMINGYTPSSTYGNLIDNKINYVSGSTICFELMNGITDISWDVGLVPTVEAATETTTSTTTSTLPLTGFITISGIVFHDTNNNGNFDQLFANTDQVEEYALEDVQVALFDCSGKIIYITTTDTNGMYGFRDIPVPESYYVQFSPPGGYKFGTTWNNNGGEMAISDDVSNSVHPENGRTVCKEYGVGDDEYSLDAGFVPEEDVVVGELPSSDDGQQQQQPQPQLLPTPAPTSLGNGTPCSGSKCPLDGMCRNQAGLCGSTIAFCNPNNVWDSSCPDKVITRSPTKSPAVAAQSNAPSRSSSPTLSIHPSFIPTMSLHPTQTN